MQKKKIYQDFSSAWADMDTVQRTKVVATLCEKAYVAAITVYQWGAGIRTPKAVNRMLINKCLEDFNIEISWTRQ